MSALLRGAAGTTNPAPRNRHVERPEAQGKAKGEGAASAAGGIAGWLRARRSGASEHGGARSDVEARGGAARRVVDAPIGAPRGPVDAVLAAMVIALVGFGVVMVYSASAIEATVRYKDAQFFLKRQAVYAVVAIAAMFVTSRLDYRRLKPFTYPILIGVVGMLLATVVGLGHRAGNAYRWLAIGPVHIQPAECAKLGIVIWLAYSLSKKQEQIKSFSVGFLPHLLVVGVLMLLCLKQPDFGSAMVLLFLTFTLLFVAGARVPYIASFSAMLALAAAALVRFSGYRYARYLAWIDMESNRADLAYQPFQSVMSFGSGGLSGLGLGRGLQVLYLPEAHTDFISAIVGEELGFLGVVGLCAAYLVIVSRGVKAALEANDDYGSFMAFGIATLFGVQAMVNLCVAMAILPTKGLTLPFISYGGSSLLVNAVAAGLLLSISRSRRMAPAVDEAAMREPLPSASAVVMASASEGAP
ncbi:putative lipid II flippase FtsW [Chondromyces apiculatus]|uniref:Probable peptidoglycan glycosyltransferase FtsW n=1 Tax=Chondromyces apiculatus DSM 436 TaxID=1192034 RepID=A0A017T045_9BACT|nr:putative lipid II flippase FtsW [Chondromyces apiculatus]EYF02387.1 Cell division protein FtsW [Chondromyces apiculatus DSM 436]